jgi:DNA invertase Pin-like site-specific DNA recombinase
LTDEIARAVEARNKLRAVGRKRKRLKAQEAELAKATGEALTAARGIVSTKEAADLVGLHRTTVYQQYGGGESDGSSEEQDPT